MYVLKKNFKKFVIIFGKDSTKINYKNKNNNRRQSLYSNEKGYQSKSKAIKQIQSFCYLGNYITHQR